MIEGRVTDGGDPVINVEVAGQQREVVIDTGFNGDLELPESLRRFVNPRFSGRLAWSLAGGQTIEQDTFAVEFPFDGEMVEAQSTFVPGETILLGTHMMRRHRLEIDFPNAAVVLERAPTGRSDS